MVKKWAAAEARAAMRVRGVKAAANDIEMHLPSEAQRSDADIAAAVLGETHRRPAVTPEPFGQDAPAYLFTMVVLRS